MYILFSVMCLFVRSSVVINLFMVNSWQRISFSHFALTFCWPPSARKRMRILMLLNPRSSCCNIEYFICHTNVFCWCACVATSVLGLRQKKKTKAKQKKNKRMTSKGRREKYQLTFILSAIFTASFAERSNSHTPTHTHPCTHPHTHTQTGTHTSCCWTQSSDCSSMWNNWIWNKNVRCFV